MKGASAEVAILNFFSWHGLFFRCSLPKAMSISRSEILRKKRKSGGDRKLKSALSKGFRICWLGTSLGVKFSGETRTQSVLWMLIAIAIAEKI